MKGLILKDLLQLKTYKKTVIIFVLLALFLVFCGNSQNPPIFITVLLTFWFGMFGIIPFSYDEQANAERYIQSMPVTKKEIVLARYIHVFGIIIVGALAGTILSIVSCFATTKEFLDIREVLIIFSTSLFGVSFLEAIEVPCFYKFGMEKGRLTFIIVILMAVFGVITAATAIESLNITYEQIEGMMLKLVNILPIILMLLTFVVSWISYKISCKIYKKKEV